MGLRIVIAEDSMLVRAGVRHVIDRQPDLDVVGDCADLPSLRALLDEARPEVGVVVLKQYAEPAYANELTARTPVRVATAPATAVDRGALEELARGHRRELTDAPAGQ